MKTFKLKTTIILIFLIYAFSFARSEDKLLNNSGINRKPSDGFKNNSEFENQKKLVGNQSQTEYFSMDNSGFSEVNILGEYYSDNFGSSLSDAGDVNGDGYNDLIVGAYKANSVIGRAYIYLGGPAFDSIPDITLNGSPSELYFGVVSSAGDVNNDGFSDVIVSSYLYSKAYIYFGGVSMDNIADITLSGENVNDNFGFSLSTAGDVNNDGYSDVVITSPGVGITNGRVYVYLGGSIMDNIADLTIRGLPSAYYTSVSVSYAGDVNNDGFSDIIIGCAQPNATSGNAYIYFGGVSMNDTADVTMTGESYNSYFGQSVHFAGDVNRDGFDDVIVGGARYNNYTGCAYIFYGGTVMNNIADVSFYGEETYTNFGINCSSAGDINHDGYSDVIIGANRINSWKGKTYIYYGGQSMNNIADTSFLGENSNDSYGATNTGMSNLKGDGRSNIISGAPGFNSNTGKVKVYSLYQKSTTINISAFLEGFYDINSGRLNLRDTLQTFLRDLNSPYSIVDSSSAVIDSVSLNGIFKFSNAQSGNYYIVLKSRNGLETWSKSAGVTLNQGDSLGFDFTSSASQAFGNNLVQSGNKFCIYSGDINKNGVIDLSDILLINNDAAVYTSGHSASDLNGDLQTDLSDALIAYNNSSNFVSIKRP